MTTSQRCPVKRPIKILVRRTIWNDIVTLNVGFAFAIEITFNRAKQKKNNKYKILKHLKLNFTNFTPKNSKTIK